LDRADLSLVSGGGRRDREARAWFIGGQAAIAGAVALFILEIRHGPREPSNIPFSGLVLEPGRLGVRAFCCF